MARTITDFANYDKSFQIQAGGCYGISFFRPSTAAGVKVEGIPIEAGQTLSIKQNVGDEDNSTYMIQFDSNTDALNTLFVTRIIALK